MIPVSADQVKKVPEPESGATLHLRYLVDKYQDEFMALQGQDRALEPYRLKAQKNVDGQTHGKKKKERIELVAKEMTRLAVAAGIDVGDGLLRAKQLVDIFLCGWEGGEEDGQKWPSFPKDKKPSTLFLLGDLVGLADIITDHIEELTGMGAAEAKK